MYFIKNKKFKQIYLKLQDKLQLSVSTCSDTLFRIANGRRMFNERIPTEGDSDNSSFALRLI